MEKPTQQVNREEQGLMVLTFDAHKVPEFVEVKGKDWVIYGKEDRLWYNRYCDYLLQLYNRSGKNNALINGICHYVAGNGIEIDAVNLTVAKQSELFDFINNANKYKETISDIMYKCTLDKKIFGGWYLEIIWDKGGKNFEYYHMDYTKLRIDKGGEGYWYSEDWSKRGQKPEPIEEGGTGLKFIPKFDLEKKKGSQIYAYIDYRPGLKWYPLPDYIGAVPYAEIDYEISNYWLNGIKSGFNAGTIISFNNGKPTKEAKDQIEKSLKNKFVGTDRANSLLINWSQNKENAPTIEHLTPSNFDKQYEAMNKAVQEELYTGHRITNPLLFGVPTPGKLGGNNDEIVSSYELFKKTYIEPFQKIMNDEFNYLLQIKGFEGRIKLKETKPLIEKLTEATLKEVLTKDELRQLAGYSKENKEENNKLLDSLTVLNPSIATIVLANLTVNELRGLVGAPPVADGDKVITAQPEKKQIVSTAIHHFKTEEEFKSAQIAAVEVFKKYGVKRDDYHFVSIKPLYFTDDGEEIIEQAFANILDGENIKKLYKDILQVIKDNPLADSTEIAKALKIDVKKVEVALERLISEGAIEEGKQKSVDEKIDTKDISDDAADVLKEQPSDIGKLVIMYSYDWRPGFNNKDKKKSRDFCKDLMAEKLLFTRQDIENISNEVGWDVWRYRGGFWHNKENDKTYPYCRHLWHQNVVKKK